MRERVRREKLCKRERERERERESKWRDRSESERKKKVKKNKISFFGLQLSYSATLHLGWHCSTIANFFCKSKILQDRVMGNFCALMLKYINLWHIGDWM